MASNIRIAVIGMSGQGKSTLLNALADDGDGKDHFAVAPGRFACTTEVNEQNFTLKLEGGGEMQMTLVDTMGFPDPDPARALEFYDRVVKACRQPLNAIIWVHKAGRKNIEDVAKMRALMQEFNNAKPPIYHVVNGCENYARKRGAEKENKKAEARKIHFADGQEMVKASGIQVTHIIAGADIDDLYDLVKVRLAVLLANTTPEASELKTHEDLDAEIKACKTEDDKLKLDIRKSEEAAKKAEKNVVEARKTKRNLEIGAATAAAGAVGLAFVPMAGPFLAATAGATATALTAAAAAMVGEIDASISKASEAAKSLKAKQGDKTKAEANYKRAREEFERVDAVFQNQKRLKAQMG